MKITTKTISKLKTETITYLNSSSAYRKRLEEAIKRDKKGLFVILELFEV